MEVLILILIGAPLAFYSWRYFQRERDEKIVAEGMEAIARLNKDIFEERGHRLEFEKQPDGETKLVYRKIWPDEEIERKAQEDGEAMRNVIGTNLLKSKSDAAKELISFLNDMY